MRTPRIQRVRATARRDDGFTLIEMCVALALAAVSFAFIGHLFGSGLKALSVQKQRSRGIEVATKAIEDLQRYSYDSLGLCAPASGDAPAAGLTDTVFLANCTNPVFGEPCTPVVGAVPRAGYDCKVGNTTYTVRRYVAWGDTARTVKRLAVFVDWQDEVGRHQVSQQSSLRAPDQGSVVGVAPPTVVASSLAVGAGGLPPSSTNPVKLDTTGTIQTKITFRADVDGIPDSVFATFLTLVDGQPIYQTLALTNTDPYQIMGTQVWSASLDAGSTQFTFGAGTQFVQFNVYRTADGKVNSKVHPQIVTFVTCDASLTNCPPITPAPSIDSTKVQSSSFALTPDGQLCAPLVLSADTSNVTLSDTVSVSFATLAGPYSVALKQANNNKWSVTLDPAYGYSFAGGAAQTFYFTAAEVYDPATNKYGQTAAKESAPVTFSGSC